MATSYDILKRASLELGYSRWNDPKPGTKYGRWYEDFVDRSKTNYDFGASGVPYCCMFVSYVLNECGFYVPGFPAASCIFARNKAKQSGLLLANKYDAQPGDIVFFDWDPQNKNDIDHVGFVEKNCGSYIQTIEGNTSPGTSGSQGNGGGVYRRTRSFDLVSSVIRSKYSASNDKPSQPAKEKLIVDGLIGYDSILWMQEVLGTTPDGIISGQVIYNKKYFPNITNVRFDSGRGSKMVAKWQKKIGANPDGIIGPITVIKHQEYLRDVGYKKHEIDGYFGPNTGYNTQNSLNSDKF